MYNPGVSSALYRPLKVYAFDPTLGRRHGNYMTLRLDREPLLPGPRGRKVEVIDYDASNDCYYKPVDLGSEDVLLQGGLPPSETDPRFHQQMVYAVVTKTMENFRQALGRDIEWTRRGRPGSTAARPQPLRVFPHAVQEANAYYDPRLHALLFGYFAAAGTDSGVNVPGQTVFSCLSHDIVAHETAHALVHDCRHFYMEPTGPDTLAFHEAFADIVALFQHFSFDEAVLDHIRRTGGVLHRDTLNPLTPQSPVDGAARPTRALRPPTMAEEAQRNVLVGLARQFGEAMGMRAALRSALGSPADPSLLEQVTEPHARGAILVAAVFDAFFTVYAQRMRDLLQIAYGGAAPPNGELSAELAARLCGEATKTSRHFLTMCIRALDYCPPVDITFGDFLRALITADSDLVEDDDRGYRDIVIDAFRRRGIRPAEASSWSESSLRWEAATDGRGRPLRCSGLKFDVIWGTPKDALQANARILSTFAAEHAARLNLARPTGNGLGIQAWTFHPVHRVGPDGQLKFDIVAELVQKQEVPLDPTKKSSPTRVFRGGTTLVLEARTGVVRYSIYKQLKTGPRSGRLARQREFWTSLAETTAGAFRDPASVNVTTNFATLHRGY